MRDVHRSHADAWDRVRFHDGPPDVRSVRDLVSPRVVDWRTQWTLCRAWPEKNKNPLILVALVLTCGPCFDFNHPFWLPTRNRAVVGHSFCESCSPRVSLRLPSLDLEVSLSLIGGHGHGLRFT